MTPNDNIPETMQEQIKADAQLYTKDEGYQRSYIAGATAWAGWKVKFDELKDVLQEFVSNHEAGLLPNRFVYEKAIKILNDGK